MSSEFIHLSNVMLYIHSSLLANTVSEAVTVREREREEAALY